MPERVEGEVEEQNGSRPFWSGTITFGLVSVPVELLPANRPRRASLRMLAPDGTPLKREYWSAGGKEPVDSDRTIHAYELENGRFVEVSDEELEELAPRKTREIDLRLFVDRDDLDPVFFERAYFLAPSKGATKPYRLLVAAMEEAGKAGIATFVMRDREYLVAIIAENGLLRAETMRFADEIRTAEDAGLPEPARVEKKAVQRLSRALGELFTEELDPDELEDRRARGIEKIVRSRLASGKGVVSAPVEEDEGGRPSELDDRTVIDLMEELRRRMKGGDAREESARRSTGAAPRRAPRKGARRSAPGRKSGAADLASRSKQELYEMAQELEIEGRSKMTRDELVRAIRRSA